MDNLSCASDLPKSQNDVLNLNIALPLDSLDDARPWLERSWRLVFALAVPLNKLRTDSNSFNMRSAILAHLDFNQALALLAQGIRLNVPPGEAREGQIVHMEHERPSLGLYTVERAWYALYRYMTALPGFSLEKFLDCVREGCPLSEGQEACTGEHFQYYGMRIHPWLEANHPVAKHQEPTRPTV